MGTEQKNGEERFPTVKKVFEKFEAGNASWPRVFGYALLLLGAELIDFPGAIVKTGKDLKEKLKQPPYNPK